MKKRWLSVGMAGLLALSVLTGCGGKTATEPKTSGSGTEKQSEAAAPGSMGANKTIVVSTQAGPGAQESWEAVADAYAKIHPDVTIKVDLKANEGYDQWVRSTLSTENPAADVIAINFAGDAATGKSINFNDYIHNNSPYSDGTWQEQFDYSRQKTNMATGVFDALSLTSVQVLWQYNADIFKEVGVEAPKTWDELISVCEKLEAAGYQPIAMQGNYDSFYSGPMGWLAQIYADQTTRTMVEKNRAQKGDYCYDPDIDAAWKLDLNDPWNDDADRVTQNPARTLANVRDGVYRGDTEGMRTVWTNFAKVFPRYAGGDAFFGMNYDGAKALFYQGKAAMWCEGAWGIINYMNDMATLDRGEAVKDSSGAAVEGIKKFTLGTFNMPSMAGEGIEAPARTIEVAAGFIGCISKDQDHNDLVVDFMQYYSSEEGQSIAVKAMLDAGGIVTGPSLVYGVKYPEEVEKAFAAMTFIGNAQKDFNNLLARGIGENEETYRDFYQYSHEYLDGSITIDEWLQKHQENIMGHLKACMMEKGVGDEDLNNPQNQPTGK